MNKEKAHPDTFNENLKTQQFCNSLKSRATSFCGSFCFPHE